MNGCYKIKLLTKGQGFDTISLPDEGQKGLMKMLLNCFELICRNNDNSANEYYYFTGSRIPRTPNEALKNGYAPDKLRLLCEECNVNPISIRLVPPHEYLIKKYFINWYNGFPNGYRVNWKHARFITRYRISFCDAPDLSTAFGHDAVLFWTREEAEAYLRRAWRNAITEEVNGAYRIEDAYLMIDKIDNVAGEE